MKRLYFNDLSVFDKFMFNGNEFIKVSSRTARMTENKRVFLFY